MLEAVKYLCDFFFGDGCVWHFLGLCVLCAFIGGARYTNIYVNKDKED